MTQVEEADEIAASVRYAAALSPALALTCGREEKAKIVLDVTRPDLRVVVTVDEAVHVTSGDSSTPAPDSTVSMSGDAVPVLEALSVRKPWPQPCAPDKSWLVEGIATAFESAPAS
jgi:hypothetical protein